MLQGRAKRVVTSWMVIGSVLAGLFAPRWTHAAVAGADLAWIEICTAQGSKWVPVEDAEPARPPAPAAGAPLDHCGLCPIAGAALGLPPEPEVVARGNGDLGDPVPPAFQAAPRTLPARLTAQPRAPPPAS